VGFLDLYETLILTCFLESSEEASLKTLGRVVPKIASLFVDLIDLVAESDQHILREAGELEDESNPDFDDKSPEEIKALKHR